MIAVPRAEIQPAGILDHHVLFGRDRVILSHGNHLLAVGQFIQIVEDRRDRTQVRRAGAETVIPVIVTVVLIISHDVYIVIARIPSIGVCIVIAVVFPDDIVEVILFGQCGVQQFPQFLVYFCATVTPPEPGSTVAVVAFITLRLMQRTENDRHIGILEFLELFCQILHCLLEVFILLGAFLHCVCSIKGAVRCLVVLIGAFLPVYDVAQCIVVEVNGDIDMPRCSDNTVAVLCPLDSTLRCTVIPAVQRVVVHKVKATDRRQLSGVVLDIVEFLFRIAVIAAAVDLLLSGNDVRTVNALEVGHQRLGLLGCLRVYRRIGCLFILRLGSLCQRHVVIQAVAPAAAEGDGIFALGQFQVAPVEVVPVVCVCDLDGLGSCAVIRTCDSYLCLTNIVRSVAQIHDAACHQTIHTGLRCVYGKAHSSGIGDPDKAVTGITRICLAVYICRHLCVVFQSKILTLRREQRICRRYHSSRYSLRHAQAKGCGYACTAQTFPKILHNSIFLSNLRAYLFRSHVQRMYCTKQPLNFIELLYTLSENLSIVTKRFLEKFFSLGIFLSPN